MPAVRGGVPLTRHVHYVSGVQDSVAEEMVELQSSSVYCPLVFAARVKEVITFGGQHGQVLNVTPSQL